MTALELLDAAIERIEAADPGINAVVMRWFDHARRTAAGPLPDGMFGGVPLLLKDWLAAYAGQPAASGNRRLKEAAARPALANSVLVSRFWAAGVVSAGRTNTPEFANQVTTEPVAWGATRNPWNLARSPGGSSGGAAAAIAAGMVPVAHATDESVPSGYPQRAAVWSASSPRRAGSVPCRRAMSPAPVPSSASTAQCGRRSVITIDGDQFWLSRAPRGGCAGPGETR